LIPENLPIFRPEYLTCPTDNTLLEMEKAHIRRILTENQWNVAKSAKILGIDRSTLYNKIKRHNIRKAS
jgi:transcriptional regulator of acetoin/glycerol metabolism